MSKAVMISIRPEWCEKIAHGGKTVEVRKTRPKLEPPFKCYIYCTKAPDVLVQVMRDGDDNYGCTYHGPPAFIKTTGRTYGWLWHRQQKVIGEFVCDSIETHDLPYPAYQSEVSSALLTNACLSYTDLHRYVGSGNRFYGWHISDLLIYDTPKQLSTFQNLSFRKAWEEYAECEARFGEFMGVIPPDPRHYSLRRAPQSWCYVEELT